MRCEGMITWEENGNRKAERCSGKATNFLEIPCKDRRDSRWVDLCDICLAERGGLKPCTMDTIYTLYDDDSTREKLTVMSKWQAMVDDERNPKSDFAEEIEAFLQPGKTYRLTMKFQEVDADKPIEVNDARQSPGH